MESASKQGPGTSLLSPMALDRGEGQEGELKRRGTPMVFENGKSEEEEIAGLVTASRKVTVV